MIKLEEKQISESPNTNLFVCLSPFCFNPKNRIFQSKCQSKQEIYTHSKEQCAKWVISVFQLCQPVHPYKPKQFNNLELNFNEEPVQALRKIVRLDKSDWKKQLTKEINGIKKQINSALEVLQQNLLKKVNDILDKKQFYTDIQNLVDKIFIKPSENKRSTNDQNDFISFNRQFLLTEAELLTNQLNKYFYEGSNNISQLKSVLFLQKVEIKEQVNDLKNKIQQLQKKLLQEKSKIKARTDERIQFYEWMFQKEDNTFNKLQMVGNLFNLRQPNYHIEKQTIQLNCMLCQKFVLEKMVAQNIKQLKKFMAQQLNIHLYNQHHDRIFYSYLKKVSKTKCQELVISDLLTKLGSIEELHLIDRQTGVAYTEDFVSSDIFSIDILTKKNVHLAKNNYLLIESKETINSFVSILAYECFSQKKKFLVVSTRFEHLQQISKIFGFNNVNATKSYNGLENIKFQQDRNNAKIQNSKTQK